MVVTNLNFILTGPNGSAGKQTIGFQGCYADKQKIKFKREGDGFIADFLCNNSFTYSFHFRNIPPPQKYLHLKLSATHSRELGLFHTLLYSNYKCCIDNLYTSVNFLGHTLKYKMHAMIEEACCSGGFGFPNVVKQEEVRRNKKCCLKQLFTCV